MKRLALVGLMALPWASRAQSPWLNIMGDAADPRSDVVEIDTSKVDFSGITRRATIRVNRSTERLAYGGGTYRSYISEVEFDCSQRSAHHKRMVFFDGPLWDKETRTVYFNEDKAAPMVFAATSPNPTERLVNAACRTQSVQTR